MVRRSQTGGRQPRKREEKSKTFRCHLPLFLGRDRLRVADVERKTGIDRNTLYRYYHERMRVIDLDDVAVLCRMFKISIGQFLELIEVPPAEKKSSPKPAARTSKSVQLDTARKPPARKTANSPKAKK